jgi:hypothetical protein
VSEWRLIGDLVTQSTSRTDIDEGQHYGTATNTTASLSKCSEYGGERILSQTESSGRAMKL